MATCSKDIATYFQSQRDCTVNIFETCNMKMLMIREGLWTNEPQYSKSNQFNTSYLIVSG